MFYPELILNYRNIDFNDDWLKHILWQRVTDWLQLVRFCWKELMLWIEKQLQLSAVKQIL